MLTWTKMWSHILLYMQIKQRWVMPDKFCSSETAKCKLITDGKGNIIFGCVGDVFRNMKNPIRRPKIRISLISTK